MRKQEPRAPIRLGIAGLGPVWEQRYRDSISRLENRIKITAVFDSVHNRACHVASMLGAAPVQGVRALFERPDLQGMLMFDSTWLGTFPLQLACEYQLPMLIASVPQDRLQLADLYRQAHSQGLLMMAECAHRHDSCTGRLKELMVTKLGSANRIEIRCSSSASPTSRIPEFVDWCQYIVQQTPHRVRATQLAGSELALEISYQAGNAANSVESRIVLDACQDLEGPDLVKRIVYCQRGKAIIRSESVITWETDDESHDEVLLSERSPLDIVLDQFCRRIAGGLVPVPDLLDVIRANNLVAALRHSLSNEREVELSDFA